MKLSARAYAATAIASLAFACAMVAVHGSAHAVEDDATRTHVVPVNGYDVDFTLPTAAKAGCMVCHGDENLIRLKEDGLRSFYVDPAQLEAGPHAAVQCAGCHLDFAFTAPHVQSGEDWQRVSRSACKNCHQDQNRALGQGVHRGEVDAGGVTPSAETTIVPLCGDCHGGHDIVALTDNPAGQSGMHANGWEVCGRCHEEHWENYNDYYHGRAYHRGALDAPACWDCHGYHDIYPSDDRRSRVHPDRLAQTCGACHLGDVNEGYLEYAELIHGQGEMLAANPLYSLIQRLRSAVADMFSR
ncbi:MAG: hypothetical protein KGZ40_06130 [Clostridiales bacterium]|nr:hypothetical protein [Clostridiales bacterium]